MLESGRLPLEVGRIHTGEFMRLGLEVVEVKRLNLGWRETWTLDDPLLYMLLQKSERHVFWAGVGGWSFGSFSGELKNIELLYIPNLWP